MSNIAPLHGKTSLYWHMPLGNVMIQKDNYKHIVVKEDTFKHLFFELNDTRAALKEDCIQYVVYERGKPLACYPDWFIAAYDNGDIYEEEDYDEFIFYNEYGDIVMSHGSVVVRNYMGHLNYMERYEFDKYYDVQMGDDV